MPDPYGPPGGAGGYPQQPGGQVCTNQIFRACVWHIASDVPTWSTVKSTF